MKLLRIFPRLTKMTPTDRFSFVGDPQLPCFLPADISEVHISATFTWDIEEAKRLAKAWGQYYPQVLLGGPAFDDPANSFIAGRYIRQGVTFTSRGCNFDCPWCLVPKREGKIRAITFSAGNIVQDNNLLQCSSSHIDKVFYMLRHQHQIQFTGGLDARLLTESKAEEIRGLRINQLFFSADTKEALKPLEKATKKLQLPRDKIRCYVLLAFDGETISKAEERLEAVWKLGAMPFAQLYQPPDKYIYYSKEWKELARRWSRPAIMKTLNDTPDDAGSNTSQSNAHYPGDCNRNDVEKEAHDAVSTLKEGVVPFKKMP